MTARKSSKKPTKTLAAVAKGAEAAAHARLKSAVKEILAISGLKVDVEVKLNFTGNLDEEGYRKEECSIDVAGFGASAEGRQFLLVFECKSGANIRELNKLISAWEAHVQKIPSSTTKIISSELGTIKKYDLERFEEIKVCYVFGAKVDAERFKQIESEFTARHLHAWNNKALAYYKKSAKTIGKAIRNELLKEFDVGFKLTGAVIESAIKFKQGHNDLFLFGATPADLLAIAYVSRRASQRPEAYQRILNRDRMRKISEFVSAKNPILPNSIIIAFDGNNNIQSRITYDESNSELSFPKIPCCAWIIDGQHRVYGFLNTKFDKASPPVFRLPVVAFKNLDLLMQNRAFVDINYNQKKIDPTLLCDLAASLPDFQNELTWPSIIAIELNKTEPLKDRIRISELDPGNRVSISSFARYGLLETLLGFDRKKRDYGGPLFEYAQFNESKKVTDAVNRAALKQQVDVLKRYFEAVAANTATSNPETNPWLNTKKYSLLKPTGINAMFLVLASILGTYPRLEKDIGSSLKKYLEPICGMDFSKGYVADKGGGWKGFKKLANVALRRLRKHHGDSLKLY